MIRAPPRSTRTDTLCPYTTLFRSPCARLDAIGADAGLRDVQINLHDPPLAPDFLDQEGEPDLWNLADITRPAAALPQEDRSEEHTSELQSLMRISYAVFCLQTQTPPTTPHPHPTTAPHPPPP